MNKFSECTKFLQKKNYQKALDCFEELSKKAKNDLQYTEILNGKALANLALRKPEEYLECQAQAADGAMNSSPDQAADFMRDAGEILEYMDRKDLAKKAYTRAASFFELASYNDPDEDMRAAWKGWSHFCKAKKNDEKTSEEFRNASRCFLEAIKAAPDFAVERRQSNAYKTSSMSHLAKFNSDIKASENASKDIENALMIEPSNNLIKLISFCIEGIKATHMPKAENRILQIIDSLVSIVKTISKQNDELDFKQTQVKSLRVEFFKKSLTDIKKNMEEEQTNPHEKMNNVRRLFFGLAFTCVGPD